MAVRDIMLFIAELNGYKAGTVREKYHFGMYCYMAGKAPHADLGDEEGRKELHEIIWLERLYNALDSQSTASGFKLSILKKRLDAKEILRNLDLSKEWSVPVELDASASMLGYIGALLGDSRLLAETNMHGTSLNDPWNRGMNRTKFKHAATPMLYGSSRACHELWQSKGHKYTMEDITSYNAELAQGSLGVANMFKDFLIHNCKPQATMRMQFATQDFTIECNRFRNVGETTRVYSIYDSETDSVRTIHHTDTVKVPDLEQFRRYFVTLLVHNLDGFVADKVVSAVIARDGFCLDIHDAFLVHPRSARYTRKMYAQQMDWIYANRKQILADYFKSIGIGAEAQAKWDALMEHVVPVEGFKCRPTVLK